MKGSGRMAKSMAKVKKKIFFYDLVDSHITLLLLGNYFYRNGNRYEGEWKNDKRHGLGKNNIIFFA